MNLWKSLPLVLGLLAPAASAEPSVSRLWESAAEFRTPESVLHDARRKRLYVSNVDGHANQKDGKGFISILAMDGKIERLEWVTGLNAPKGMALVGNRLYVADIDQLVEIDATRGVILKRHTAPGAKFLNDVAADSEGKVYVSDMLTNRIHRLARGRFAVWLESPQLESPNGLRVSGGQLYVGSWGVMTNGFATDIPGRVKRISLADKSIADFAGTKPVGNLDGIEVLADGRVLATDWLAGGLMLLGPDGSVKVLDKLSQGSADIGYIATRDVVLVPMMKKGTVIGFRFNAE